MFNNFIYGLLGLFGLGAVSVGYFFVSDYKHQVTLVAELREQVRRTESRLQGAYMRIERRDNAIAALPASTREKVQEWVKSGNIPVYRNPFDGVER